MCVPVIVYYCANNTTQTLLTIFPLILQAISITQMLSAGGKRKLIHFLKQTENLRTT